MRIRGKKLGAVLLAVTGLRQRGFSDQEAEAVVRIAIDPARYDEAINLLAQRMTRREARNSVRAIRQQAARSSLQSDQSK